MGCVVASGGRGSSRTGDTNNFQAYEIMNFTRGSLVRWLHRRWTYVLHHHFAVFQAGMSNNELNSTKKCVYENYVPERGSNVWGRQCLENFVLVFFCVVFRHFENRI